MPLFDKFVIENEIVDVLKCAVGTRVSVFQYWYLYCDDPANLLKLYIGHTK